MKILLPIIFLPFALFAQNKESNLYVKLSGGPLFIKNQDGPSVIGFLTVGPIIGKKKGVSLSFAAGYFKFKNDTKAIIPIGFEFTALPFKSTKVSPIVMAGVYHPVYNSATTKGSAMASMGGGIVLSATQKVKFALTGHFYPLWLKNTVRTGSQTIKTTSNINMFSVSLNVLLVNLR